MDSIKVWNPEFVEHFTCAITAPRRAGKSTLLKHLYINYWRDTHDITVVFTDKFDRDFFSGFVSGNLIIDGYQPDVLDRIKKKQDDLLMKKGEMLDILIIFDDVVDKRTIKHSDEILQIFLNGRHQNLSICYITQDIFLLDTSVRDNLDYMIILKQNGGRNVQYLGEMFIGYLIDDVKVDGLKSSKYGEKIIRNICQDYWCVVLVFVNDGDFYNKIFKYRANLLE